MAGDYDELLFVEAVQPGRKHSPDTIRAQRSHIRRATMRCQKGRTVAENIRFIDYSKLAKKRNAREKKRKRANTAWPDATSASGAGSSKGKTTRPLATQSLSVAARNCSVRPEFAIPISHPFTLFAADHVRLSPSRLDELFKSNAFRAASEPLFDNSHVDGNLSMHLVFPTCESESVFLNALIYATARIVSQGRQTTESLLLQERTIQLLNEKLGSLHQCLYPATIGAIMILKSVAIKFPDAHAHNTHSQGLIKALKLLNERGISMTPAAERAIFWLDLLGSMVVESKHQLGHTIFPLRLLWGRESNAAIIPQVPIGYRRHRDVLPNTLISCISDLAELQDWLELKALALLPHHAKYYQIDSMQASIESRLASQAQICQGFGLVAEATRLALFLCTYCSWTETWNSGLIPSRIAENLLSFLQSSLMCNRDDFKRTWWQHMDLFLWTLLITSSVADLDHEHTEELKSSQERLLHLVRVAFQDWNLVDLKRTLQSALHDFSYCSGWPARRYHIKERLLLELSIGLLDSEVTQRPEAEDSVD